MDDELEQFYTPNKTKPRLLQAFFIIAQTRYITFLQLKSVKKSWSQHIATKKNLTELSELGYLQQKR